MRCSILSNMRAAPSRPRAPKRRFNLPRRLRREIYAFLSISLQKGGNPPKRMCTFCAFLYAGPVHNLRISYARSTHNLSASGHRRDTSARRFATPAPSPANTKSVQTIFKNKQRTSSGFRREQSREIGRLLRRLRPLGVVPLSLPRRRWCRRRPDRGDDAGARSRISWSRYRHWRG